MNVCDRWVNSGFISPGSGPGHHCGQPLFEDSNLCRQHFEEAEAVKRQFEDQMARATRHLPGIATSGQGVSCGCGTFVPLGENHPWELPARIEDAKRIMGYKPCLKCAYRWGNPDLNIHCDCEEGWISK